MGILVDVSFRQRVFDTGVWGAVACVRVCVVCVCVCVCACVCVCVDGILKSWVFFKGVL